MSKTKENDLTKSNFEQNQNFITKPIIKSSMYFSKCGQYLIFQKTEKHIFSAKYHLKLIEEQLASQQAI